MKKLRRPNQQRGSFQTCNAGRAGAQPYRVTRADTLPFANLPKVVHLQDQAAHCCGIIAIAGVRVWICLLR